MNYKKYYVTKDACVFYPISQKTAEMLFNNNARECLDLCWLDEYGNSYEIVDKKDIAQHDGEIFLYIGVLKDMIDSRKDLFKTLADVKSFVEETNSIPWGLRSIAVKNRWTAVTGRKGNPCYSDGKNTLEIDLGTLKVTIL